MVPTMQDCALLSLSPVAAIGSGGAIFSPPQVGFSQIVPAPTPNSQPYSYSPAMVPPVNLSSRRVTANCRGQECPTLFPTAFFNPEVKMSERFSCFTQSVFWFILAVVFSVTASAQSSERVLFSFPKSGADGTFAGHPLYLDTAGNLFGTAYNGGEKDEGTVFELSAPVQGVRRFSVLHSFKNSSDGRNPDGTIVFDASGNLYGAALGGADNSGVIYKLTPGAGGTWTLSVIYTFGPTYVNGMYPNGLTIDAAGNLYGTTYEGGTGYGEYGTVFQLTPNSGGTWSLTTLYNFSGPDGALPMASLVLDAAGNLYGTTSGGGANDGFGTVFELSPSSGGTWTETLLCTFPYGKYYERPQTAVWFDAVGNIYGTTAGTDDSPGYGSVYELTPNGDGSWTLHTLHRFGGPGDGYLPAGLVGDSSGNLFGTTASGGANNDGIVYELKKNAAGQWIEKVMHNFTDGSDGGFPGTLVMGPGNVFYGAAAAGGSGQVGVIYEIN
jgi:uncharacterized repeat protein (TIGR03803 family)